MKNIFFTFFLILTIAVCATAQHRTLSNNAPAGISAKPDSTVIDMITMREGNELVGEIRSITTSTLIFVPLNSSTEIVIQRSLVKNIRSILYKDYARNFLFDHRGASSLFMAHTAYMLPKGEGRYETIGFFVSNMYDYGVTENVTVGGGVFLFLPALRLKVGKKFAPNLNLAVGSTLATIPFQSVDFGGNNNNNTSTPSLTYGAVYGMATVGNQNSFLNLSVGALFPAGNPTLAMIQGGGFTRFTPKTALFGEVSILPDALYDINQNGIYNYNTPRRAFFLTNVGVRLLQQKTSWDLGIVAMSNPARSTAVIFFPMVGFKAYVGGN
jgi:hypothetical protein